MSASTQLIELAKAVDATQDGQVFWFKKPAHGITTEAAESSPPNDRLERFLYNYYYSEGRPVRANRPAGGLNYLGSGPSHLAPDKHVDVHSWQPGWTFLGHWHERTLLGRDGLAVWFDADKVRTDPGYREAEAWLPLMRPNLSPGFRSFLPGFDCPLQVEVRIYWSLTVGAVETFMEHVLNLMTQNAVPMSVKVATRSEMYTRADAAVMYMSESTYRSKITDLQRIHGALADRIKRTTPALSLKLADGVGFAESPTDGRSFGQFVCAALAHGVARIGREEAVSVSDKAALLQQEIRSAGLDIEAPHLQPGRRSLPYAAWEIHTTRTGQQQVGRVEERTPSTSRDDSVQSRALIVAEAIGGLIISRALTTDNVCTWVGGTAATYNDDPSSTRYRTLGRALYDGTAGIAVFLAALTESTDNAQAADVARRALRFAQRADATETFRAGLYDGSAGIYVAADLVGGLIGDRRTGGSPGTVRLGLLAAAGSASRDPSNVDLLAGQSGVILALLARLPHLSRSELIAAIELGEALLATAVIRRTGIGWLPPRSIATRPLMGMSHGVGGVALALSALAAATGQERFRQAAARAIDYENSFFDATVGNWPDLRRPVPEMASSRRSTLSFWCHGAPGILLARVLTANLEPATSLVHLPEALTSTKAAIQESLLTNSRDMSLCHGLFGLVDILLHATRTSGDRSAEDLDLIRDSVECAARVVESGEDFQCGTHGGETPSAMLGLAGIGLTLLRVHDERLPSLLNPTRIGM